MDPNREPPWAEHEKVYLLAEILKAAPIPSHVLFGVIRDANIQPRWNDMALPPGRSMRSSLLAFDNIAATYAGPDYRRAQLPAPIMYPALDASKKRPFQQDAATPMGRLIQPRPPHPYSGEFVPVGPAYTSAITSIGEPANKKKRGRPTKAEAQQRAQEAAARGEVYPPPRRGQGRASITGPSEPSPSGPDMRPHDHTPPPALAQLSSAMTPQQQLGREHGSGSSSGKRRRARPQPLELEKHRGTSEMESPLAYGPTDPSRGPPYSTYTPISAPLPSSTEPRDRDVRMEGVEETQPRTTTPHSFKDTVGI
ncbi:hypothetical protein ACN47E_004785 [Coniothyrium glycines]